MKFPKIIANSIAGDRVTIPDSAKGCVTLITIAFKRASQSQIDSWIEPFNAAFGGKPDFTFYEVPMIGPSFKAMAPMIERGMRGGIQKEKHKNIVNYYGELDSYRRTLSMDDLYSGYAFLLDREGIIRWMSQGYAIEGKINKMVEMAEQFAQENKL